MGSNRPSARRRISRSPLLRCRSNTLSLSHPGDSHKPPFEGFTPIILRIRTRFEAPRPSGPLRRTPICSDLTLPQRSWGVRLARVHKARNPAPKKNKGGHTFVQPPGGRKREFVVRVQNLTYSS